MPKSRVLFVCVGNSCRSQMAEGFARTYGKDVLEPASAGLYPAACVAQPTISVMKEKNIDLSSHFPKGIDQVDGPFDIVVNMSGQMVPSFLAPRIINWEVRDPIAYPESVHREVAAQIEGLVMGLILELRMRAKSSVPR
jgi:arsenate reductase